MSAQVRVSPQVARSRARIATPERMGGSARVFQFFLREKPFHRAAGRIGLSGLRLTALRFRRLGFELQPHELLPNFRSQRIVTIFAAVALAARRPGPHSDMI